jgi:hypothetical protein
VLTDDVLIEIFYFCQAAPIDEDEEWWLEPEEAPRAWHTLVHVCQRWRSVVLASPVYLKLFLICTECTPVREMLHIWPPSLPLLIWVGSYYTARDTIAALEQRDRVRWIVSDESCFEAEGIPTVMSEPFPALTHLYLRCNMNDRPLDFPDTFLGGSAPHLQYLRLWDFPFPTLSKLLLSTSDLVELDLWQIPTFDYDSPYAMVTCLSALTKLEYLTIGFEHRASLLRQSTPHPHPSPRTRAVLPFLTNFVFNGVSGYIDNLVALIDAPHLKCVSIEFFDRRNFQIGQLPRFISHAGTLSLFDHAKVVIERFGIATRLYPRGAEDLRQYLELQFPGQGLSSQVPSIVQMYSQLSSLLSSVEQLDILNEYDFREPVNMDNTHWLELFQPFTAVRTLRLSYNWQSFIMALTEETATSVLPALNNIYLEAEAYRPYGPEQQGLEHFIAARQHSGHPVTVQRLERSRRSWRWWK